MKYHVHITHMYIVAMDGERKKTHYYCIVKNLDVVRKSARALITEAVPENSVIDGSGALQHRYFNSGIASLPAEMSELFLFPVRGCHLKCLSRMAKSNICAGTSKRFLLDQH